MASGDNDDVGYNHRHRDEMNTNPLFNKVDGMAMSSIFASGWDPIVSLSQSESLGGGSSMVSHTEFANPHYPRLMENQGISGTSSHFPQYHSDPSFVELVPKLPGFGTGNLSEMVGHFSLPQSSRIPDGRRSPNYALNHEGVNERASTNSTHSREESQHLEEGGIGAASPNGKSRKRIPESNSPLRSYQVHIWLIYDHNSYQNFVAIYA